LSGRHLRELTDDDLKEAVGLEGASTTVGKRPLFSLSEVVASLVAVTLPSPQKPRAPWGHRGGPCRS